MGAFNYEGSLTVDPQGNVFIPHVGPIKVLGIKNAELNDYIEQAVRKVFKRNVGVYASLETSVPVKVFVTGFVRNPGLYGGLSSNSILYYLDRAGGIDPQRGSFIDITILRNNQVRAKVNLYDFLLNGKLSLIQMADGDVIFVAPKKSSFSVSGVVYNPFQFEFEGEFITGEEAMKLAKPKPEATHITITRKQGLEKYTEYYSINELDKIKIYNGDEVTVLSDRYPGTILVRIEGAHSGPHALVLPYGAKLKDVLPRIVPNVRSNLEAIQLFRKSVAQRQKEMILASLQQLQSYALTGRAETQEEATLRTKEAELIMRFVEVAKNVETKGQVVLGSLEEAKEMLLEDGDVIVIPEYKSFVMVHGEVRFPNAIIYTPGKDVDYYIKQAGGFTQRANKNVVIVLHQNGKFEEGEKAKIEPGDEIFVLPKIEAKRIEIVRGITQILYQIAVSARVLLLAW
ncbi:polysialic acid transporter [Thermodesulfobacterium sp. TA1]|uniref:polysaccharide biosynthesis/export family protein n=1 Tax=Thermodesulfobacterium sp. TA1 TaxID=2234087 RepID=UPI0012328644|nr:polysaccharide biosynthesis/export family protein [Thermodesulfobacterium sp. TA1]QER41312.1 polysialic acid transporter [Thermodesulfobacterium sp. TA1]